MRCQECGEKEAQVHVTKIINGEKKELYLCKECAEEIGELDFSASFSFDKLLTGLLNDKFTPEQQINLSPTDLQCEACGLSYKEFSRTGKLGCDQCYDFFQDRLNKVLRKIHSSTEHTGKIPQRAGARIKKRQEIEELNQQMDEAVEKEEFEKAAELRDQIKKLKTELEEEE